MLDYRSLSLVYVNWYDEGVRVLDISNPSAPRFVGHFLSPRFAAPGREDRHTREVWQDPDSNLIYVTDGNGGGLTVVRYRPSPDPARSDRPIAAARPGGGAALTFRAVALDCKRVGCGRSPMSTRAAGSMAKPILSPGLMPSSSCGLATG